MALTYVQTGTDAPTSRFHASRVSAGHTLSREEAQPSRRAKYLPRRGIAFHLYSIWLFTFSDIKTIIAPSLAFALFTAQATLVFGITPALCVEEILHQAPRALFWLWINLLPFSIENQRQPDAIVEDALNKPWRTMPTKRMAPSQARNLTLCLYPLALLASLRMGATRQCLSLMALGFWYNHLHGADNSCFIRNFINACGFNQFTSGAFEVLMGGRHIAETHILRSWLMIMASIIFTTVQTQDMYDQEGDSARGRRTVPLVCGDWPARWSIAIPMAFWCIFCPWYLGSPILGFLISGTLGGLIVSRTLILRSVREDKITFRLWNLWLVALYSLPMLENMR